MRSIRIGTAPQVTDPAFELRVALEVEAAGLAALRRTSSELDEMNSALEEIRLAARQGRSIHSPARRFHRALVGATHNAYFDGLFSALQDCEDTRGFCSEPMVIAANCEGLQKACSEYEALAWSIERRDVSTAQACMRVHLANRKARRSAAVDSC